MAGEEVPGGGESPRSTINQRRSKLKLQIGNMPRNGGLADAQFLRGAGERSPADKSGESAQTGLNSHNLRLYKSDGLCISLLLFIVLSLRVFRFLATYTRIIR